MAKAEILTEKQKQDLAKSIEINGGVVTDPDFKELQRYLELNPSEPPAHEE